MKNKFKYEYSQKQKCLSFRKKVTGQTIYSNIRIFNFRMVTDVKNYSAIQYLSTVNIYNYPSQVLKRKILLSHDTIYYTSF